METWKVQITVDGRTKIISVQADSMQRAIWEAGRHWERRSQASDQVMPGIEITDAQPARVFNGRARVTA